MELRLTTADIIDVVAGWQERLKLQDWTIQARVCRSFEMSDPGRQGEIAFWDVQKVARLSVLDPIDFPKTGWLPQDPENTIVHELLHVHFRPLSDISTPHLELAEEQAVNAIANALVEGHRFRPQWVEPVSPAAETPERPSDTSTPIPQEEPIQ